QRTRENDLLHRVHSGGHRRKHGGGLRRRPEGRHLFVRHAAEQELGPTARVIARERVPFVVAFVSPTHIAASVREEAVQRDVVEHVHFAHVSLPVQTGLIYSAGSRVRSVPSNTGRTSTMPCNAVGERAAHASAASRSATSSR